VLATPAADQGLLAELASLQGRLNDILLELQGDTTRAKRWEATVPSIADRVNAIVQGQWFVTSAPTQTHRQGYAYAADAFQTQLAALTALVADLERVEATIEAAGGPWTPSRLPEWNGR